MSSMFSSGFSLHCWPRRGRAGALVKLKPEIGGKKESFEGQLCGHYFQAGSCEVNVLSVLPLALLAEDMAVV